MIQLFNLTKEYNDNKALDDVSLTINKGEFVFLVGASGAGKSTLLRLLMREELPTSGQIMIEGRSIVRMKKKEIPFYKRKLGIIFQDFRLLQDRTVYENVAFALEAMGISVKEVRKKVPLVLQKVGLEHKGDSFPNELSGGEQQRVAVARAIVNNPTILIADEPTGNLDPKTSREIMDLLAYINGKGTTVITATHDNELVDELRKRVIVLREGRVVRDSLRGGYFDGGN